MTTTVRVKLKVIVGSENRRIVEAVRHSVSESFPHLYLGETKPSDTGGFLFFAEGNEDVDMEDERNG